MGMTSSKMKPLSGSDTLSLDINYSWERHDNEPCFVAEKICYKGIDITKKLSDNFFASLEWALQDALKIEAKEDVDG